MSAFALFKYLKPYRVKCIVGPLFKLLEAILELYMPFLLAQVIDKGIATGDYEYVRRMSFVLVGLVVVGFALRSCVSILQVLRHRASELL